jgi:hypothetical protein
MRWRPLSTPAAALRGRKSDQVGDEVGDQVGDDVGDQAGDDVGAQVAPAVEDQVGAGCCPSGAVAVDATCGQIGTV